MTTGGSSDSVSRIREVFLRARELAEGVERETYLDESCRDQPQLRVRVMRMLTSESTSQTFLEDSPGASSLLGGQMSLIGTVIGRYRITERLGEGGFGEVFRVEQTDPVKRELALKIIKPGMDSREVIARFEGERQALALMDHPHIAQVHDAGTTETGRPYFVMELVRGKPITTFCERKQLTVPERLILFQKVCAAVQHAHQKGIIHRDLKPSNIVITTDEVTGEAVPKIIDFGIAKSLQGPLTDQTLVTQREVLLGTPAYMSPEQLELGSENLDTRTDIYALGILLYELLSGVQPFERKTLERAAFAEVQRIIREVEPPKPSDRVRTLGHSIGTVSGTQTMATPALERVLRGDLDWIVMKAIEKERDRRYQGTGDLVEDIRRYLEDRPIEAGPPSSTYRLKKFVRRHRVGVAFSGALVLAVVTGFVLVVIGIARASRERDRAQLAELVAEAEAVRVMAVQSIFQPYQWKSPNKQVGLLLLESDAEPGPTSLALRESMDALAARFDGNPPGFKSVEPGLRRTLADSYLSLEMTADAVAQLDRVIELNRETWGTDDVRYADALVDKAFALNSNFWGTAEFSYGYAHGTTPSARQVGESIDLSKEAMAIYRRHDHVSPTVLTAIGLAGFNDTLNWEATCREMVEVSTRLNGDDSIITLSFLQNLAICLAYKGRFDEAEPLIDRFQEALRRLDDGPYTVVHSMVPTVGHLYTREHRQDEAERIYREEIARLKGKVRGEFTSTYGGALKRLDRLLDAQGRPDPEIKTKIARIALWTALDPALCRVDYTIRIQEAGNYRLYLRWDGYDHRSNTISARIRELQDGEGGEVADLYGFVVPEIPGDADFSTIRPWQCRADFERDDGRSGDSVKAEWIIPSAGSYTLQLIGTETGAAVDAFILQRSDHPDPDGKGPDRTPQDPDGIYTEVDGRVVVEAENFSSRIPGRVTDWLAVPMEREAVVDFRDSTGAGYLQVLPELDLVEPGVLVRNRALASEKNGDYARAIKLYDELVDLTPSFMSYAWRGSAYERHGEYERALEDFEKSIEMNFQVFSLENWRQFWDCHLRLGLNEKLIDTIGPIVEKEGAFDFLKMKLARARANLGLWREAIEGIRPQGPGAVLWVMRGDLYADHGEFDRAEEEFLMAVKMGRNSLRPYPKLTALYLLNEDRAASAACLETMPTPRKNRLGSNRYYLWQSILGPTTCPDPGGLEASTEGFLDRFDVYRPEDRRARCELAGAAFYRAGNHDRAVELLTEGQAIDASSWGSYRSRWMFFLAMALQELGRVEEAREWFARADACLVDERTSVPDGEDPAYPTPWDHTATVELQREEAAAKIGVSAMPYQAALPD